MFDKKDFDRKYSKEYRKKHPEWRKLYNKKYKEKFPSYNKNWRKNNMDKVRMNRKRMKLKRKGVIGSHTLTEWQELKDKFNHCCAICGMQEPFIGQYYIWLTEDHIKPITKGGNNFIENIQPLCFICNCKKWASV